MYGSFILCVWINLFAHESSEMLLLKALLPAAISVIVRVEYETYVFKARIYTNILHVVILQSIFEDGNHPQLWNLNYPPIAILFFGFSEALIVEFP